MMNVSVFLDCTNLEYIFAHYVFFLQTVSIYSGIFQILLLFPSSGGIFLIKNSVIPSFLPTMK